MAETVKKLGELFPAAGELTAIYTVPPNTRAVVSSIVVCNHDCWPTEFSISHAVGNAVDSASQYLYKDERLPPTTFVATVGLTLSAGDVLRVRSLNGLTSFNVYGSELT